MAVTTGLGNPDINSAQIDPAVRAAAQRKATVEALTAERDGWARRDKKDRVADIDKALAELAELGEPVEPVQPVKRTAAPSPRRKS